MSDAKNDIFVCGSEYFCELFSSVGCFAVADDLPREDIINRMKKGGFSFFIFSQDAFEKLRDDFEKSFPLSPFIVFPHPGQEDKMKNEISRLVRLAVGVEI